MAEPAPHLTESLKVDTSHLITEDDEPLDNPFQERQQAILTDCLYASWEGFPAGTSFVAFANVGVFGSVKQAAIVPDVLVALDREPLPADEHRAYFCWEYGKPPDLVVEVVSKEPGGENDRKLERYRDLGVPYYVIYNPFNFRGERTLKAYQRHGLGYVDIANPKVLAEVGLGFVTWQGVYRGLEGKYLRFVDMSGRMLPTGEEKADLAERKAEKAEQKAEQAEQKAEQAEQKAEQAEQKAEQAEQKAARLAEKLRQLGVDED